MMPCAPVTRSINTGRTSIGHVSGLLCGGWRKGAAKSVFLLKGPCMKKIINSLAILSIIVSLAGCASSKEPTGVWVNRDKFQAQHFKKIFVVAVTADVSVRVRMEKALAGALESKGFEVVKSVDVIPPSLDKPEKPPIDSVVALSLIHI